MFCGIFLDYDVGDGVLNLEEVSMVLEELKWVFRIEYMKLSGRDRELDSLVSSLRIKLNF